MCKTRLSSGTKFKARLSDGSILECESCSYTYFKRVVVQINKSWNTYAEIIVGGKFVRIIGCPN